ncbi:MAG: hypothetical protein Q8M19_19580 [Reyranella sp.]|nr:hypothetical protein [Reyranella sp.]
MDDTAQGFRIGAAFHSWGTLFEAVAPDTVDAGYASTEIACPSAYGFATVHAAITAPRPDRPVMGLTYELAAAGPSAKEVFAQLVIRLGAPAGIDREEENAGDENAVVLHAQWSRGNVAIALSLYGAVRPSEFGDSIGALYLNWDDIAAASAPFIGAWRAANEELARAAASAATLHTYSVAYPINPLPGPPCLHHPEILETPPPIAARLEPTVFALWSDAAGTRWHLSTATDSIVLGGPGSSAIQVMKIAPAKGGGFAGIEVGPWSVRSTWRSRAIADAARELEKLPGLAVTRHDGHDV